MDRSGRACERAGIVAPRRPSLPLSVSASFILFLFGWLVDAECPFSHVRACVHVASTVRIVW